VTGSGRRVSTYLTHVLQDHLRRQVIGRSARVGPVRFRWDSWTTIGTIRLDYGPLYCILKCMSNTFRNRKSDNRSSVNREAKSLLAKLLSTEDIRVVHSAKVSTATWSGRTKTLTLPIWKKMSGDIYDMLVCHEVGHVLYTPDENSPEVARAVKSMTNGKKHLSESAFGFLNICEDTRIERKMKTRYPGSRRSFVRGYEWIRTSGTWKLPANPNSLKFIDRVNVAAKLGAMFPVNFNTEEQVLVDRLATVNSFGDMVAVATAMYRLAQDQKKNEQPQPPQPQPEQGDGEAGDGEGEAPQPGGEGEPQEGPASTDIPDDPDENSPKDTRSSDDDTDDGEGADSTDGDGDSDGEASDGSKSDRNKPKEKDESSDESADGKSSDSDDDGSESDKDSDTDGDDCKCDGSDDGSSDSDDGSDSTDEAGKDTATGNEGSKGDENSDAPDAPETTSGIEDAIQNLVDRNATERVYVNVPKLILKNIIEDHKALHKSFAKEMGYGYEAASKTALRDLAKFEKDAKPVVNTMAKRFDMKKAADEHRRAMTAKTGRINPNRLAFYKLTDDIFLRQTLLPDGKNHGLVMFIDWSGSMDNIMGKTIKQMLNLVMFCRRVSMPFEVFGFSSNDRRNDPAQDYKSGDFEIGGLTLHNWMSGRMSAREFKRAMIHMMILVRYWTPNTGRGGRYGYRRRSTVCIPHRFELGGTPLDDAITVAMDLVPAFQSANNLQIVNTIFLTDGASSTSPIFSGGASHGDDIVVHDPKTRKDYRLGDFDENHGGSSYYSSSNSTALLLTMLRDRTASNVIGFYLMSDYYGGKISQSNLAGQMPGATPEQIAREWKRFETDKFAVSESKGYSEYYLIPADLEATTAVLATGSAESFTAMSRSKRVNRVLLNRFIDIIAK